MNRKSLVASVVAMVALLMLIAWQSGFFVATIDPTLLSPAEVEVKEDQLFTVSRQTVPITESVPATIVARDDTVISARLLARIAKVHVRAGETVVRDQLLIELEGADLVAKVRQASDQVDAMTAQADDAKRQRDRASELLDRGLTAQADVDSASARFDSLSSQLASARAALTEANVVLEWATIRAPIAGRVIERLAEPGDTITPGTPLMSLYDPLSIRAEAHVRERLAVNLKTGQEITVVLDALGRSAMGTLEEIVPAADAGSRSFLTKAAIAYDPALRPGMFARFIITVGSVETLLIPASLVTETGALDHVTVYANGRLERRFIRLGKRYDGDLVSVLAGLEAGERLVVKMRVPGLASDTTADGVQALADDINAIPAR